MIGIQYLQKLNQELSEFNSSWIDLKASFDYLYEAAKDFARETNTCNNSQSITTVASQAEYSLRSDFFEVSTKNSENVPIVKYHDGTNTVWLEMESYVDYLQNNNSSGTPTSFAILDDSIPDRVTGTATSIGIHAGGESTLTDSAATFLTELYPGDAIINTTKSYYGLVISSPTINTAVKTAMFNMASRGSAYASWAVSDAYIIQPLPRYKIFLDPPPTSATHTLTVYYYAKPLPVYSDYGIYPFATGYEEALIKYAAWKYKYRDSKQQQGDALYLFYEKNMRKAKNVNKKATGAGGLRVNWVK
jgi:hypothetical protein